LLGAILSVINGAHVDPSTFSPNMKLEAILEDKDEDPLNVSGPYVGSPSKGDATDPPMTRSRARGDAWPRLMVSSFAGRHVLLKLI
jgi:hypothetical protein